MEGNGISVSMSATVPEVSRYKVVGGGVLPGTWYCSAAAALPAPDVDMRLIEEGTIAVFARRSPNPE